MRLKVKHIGEGLHPSEVVVEVNTLSGPQRMFVDRRAVDDKDWSLAVGAPLRRDDTSLLVELPRETMSGSWRVWVPENTVSPEGKKVA